MFSQYFIDKPRFAGVISIIMILLGLLAIAVLPVSQYPQITPPQIVVSTTYPGASAQVLVDTVAVPIENQINGVENMLYMSSSSDDNGSYSLTITFDVGTDPDIAQVKVQNRLQRPMRSELHTRRQLLGQCHDHGNVRRRLLAGQGSPRPRSITVVGKELGEHSPEFQRHTSCRAWLNIFAWLTGTWALRGFI